MSCLSENELKYLLELERMGIVIRENSKIEFYDISFEEYLRMLFTGRSIEKYIPEYTGEYLVAKELAYKKVSKNYLSPLKAGDHLI